MTQEIKKPIVFVTGITGQQGNGVAHHLYSSNKFHIRGLVRNLKSTKADEFQKKFPNIQLFEGDLNVRDTLSKAVAGSDYAFLVTDYWDTRSELKELAAGKNFLDVCKETGVKHVVFSGLPSASLISSLSGSVIKVAHFDTKAAISEYLRLLKLSHTIVSYGFYFENFLSWFSPKKDSDNKFSLTIPMGNVPLCAVAVRDGGAVVAKILENPQKYEGKTIGICSEVMTVEEMAKIMSKNLGKVIEYRPMELDDFAKSGSDGAVELAEMFRFFQSYGTKIWSSEETKKIEPNLESFDTWCREHAPCFDLS